jgi:hypothetical protein
MGVSKNGAYDGIAGIPQNCQLEGKNMGIWEMIAPSKVWVILPAKLHCGRSESQAHQRHVIETAVTMG